LPNTRRWNLSMLTLISSMNKLRMNSSDSNAFITRSVSLQVNLLLQLLTKRKKGHLFVQLQSMEMLRQAKITNHLMVFSNSKKESTRRLSTLESTMMTTGSQMRTSLFNSMILKLMLSSLVKTARLE
jgi:hypothetical protein